MSKNFYFSLVLSAVAVLGLACNQADSVSNNNANANAEVATRMGPDNSEITTTTDANGVKTETRVFRNNPRVSKVVVTTRNGQRTVKVYSRSGEERVVDNVGDALTETGDAIATSAGFIADKSEDVAGEAKDVGETVADKTVEGAKKTADVTKKVGKKVKDAVTP